MLGSVLVPYEDDREVFIDNTRCGTTNAPFDVETGTHEIDLGEPDDYTPSSRRIRVKASHTPLNPLVVEFTPEGHDR